MRSRPPETAAEGPAIAGRDPPDQKTAAISPPTSLAPGSDAAALRTRSFWMIVAAQFLSIRWPTWAPSCTWWPIFSGIGYSDAAAAFSLSLVLLFATIGQPLMGVVA